MGLVKRGVCIPLTEGVLVEECYVTVLVGAPIFWRRRMGGGMKGGQVPMSSGMVVLVRRPGVQHVGPKEYAAAMWYEYLDDLSLVCADVNVPGPAERDQKRPRVRALLAGLQLGAVVVVQLLRAEVTMEHLP